MCVLLLNHHSQRCRRIDAALAASTTTGETTANSCWFDLLPGAVAVAEDDDDASVWLTF